jgi:hypothetical protein
MGYKYHVFTHIWSGIYSYWCAVLVLYVAPFIQFSFPKFGLQAARFITPLRQLILFAGVQTGHVKCLQGYVSPADTGMINLQLAVIPLISQYIFASLLVYMLEFNQ